MTSAQWCGVLIIGGFWLGAMLALDDIGHVLLLAFVSASLGIAFRLLR
jgi:hypothetical protein